MHILAIIGIILLILFGLLGFSLFGWVLKGLELIWDFLFEGCSTSFGCLIWVFLIMLLILGMMA